MIKYTSRLHSQFFKAVFLIVFLFLAGACDETVDDQTIVPKTRIDQANPQTSIQDPTWSNNQHQVLMAVIDSGVDYNHPQLIDKIHYSLKAGEPISAGWDFIGQDPWPSPYVVRTLDINQEANSEDREKSKAYKERIKHALERLPGLKNYLHPNRLIEQEHQDGLYHGTHVAGLMVYDEPRLGLLPYRVLPVNEFYKDGKKEFRNKSEVIFSHIIKALEHAIKGGAKVINLSLAVSRDKGSNGTKGFLYEKHVESMKKVEDLAKKHPQVLFVAAAGNDGQWIDDKSKLQLPCGVDAANILCVGALDRDGDVASFSNILINGRTIVFAPGEEILSTFPTKMCNNNVLNKFEDDSVFEDKDKLESFYKQLDARCSKSDGFYRASGTSMASPLVARVAGEILLKNPKLSGAEVIEEIQKQAEPTHMGPLKILKLKVKKPSWHVPENQKRAHQWAAFFQSEPHQAYDRASNENSDSYWELYLPARTQ